MATVKELCANLTLDQHMRLIDSCPHHNKARSMLVDEYYHRIFNLLESIPSDELYKLIKRDVTGQELISHVIKERDTDMFHRLVEHYQTM